MREATGLKLLLSMLLGLFLIPACNNEASNHPFAGQQIGGGSNAVGSLEQRLQSGAALKLDFQGVNSFTQGCRPDFAAQASRHNSQSALIISHDTGTAPTDESTSDASGNASNNFSVVFSSDKTFQLKVADQVVDTGTWKPVDSQTIDLKTPTHDTRVGVSVEGDILKTSCPNQVNNGQGVNATSPTVSRNDPTQPRTEETRIPDGCPDYVYLHGSPTVGTFSWNGAYPSFKKAPSQALDSRNCTYERTNDISYAEFIASYFPTGTTCVPQGRTAFRCVGAGTNSAVACPPSITIGRAEFISFGEYGTGEMIPLPPGWRVTGDQMTLSDNVGVDIWDRYGPSNRPAMRCLYSNFGRIQLARD